MKTKLALGCILIGFRCLHAADPAEVAKSEQRAIALYPDCGKEGTELFKAIESQMDRLEKENPKFFDDPDWPLMLAAKCAEKIGCKTGNSQTSKIPEPKVNLVTPEDIKKYWLDNMPKLPGILDAGYHKMRDQNAIQAMRINSGKFDDEAQDKANEINIETLRKCGRNSEADSLIAERAAYKQMVEQKKLAEETRRQTDLQARELDDLKQQQNNAINSMRSQQSQVINQIQGQQAEMEQQRRNMQFQLEEQKNRLRSMQRDPNVIYSY